MRESLVFQAWPFVKYYHEERQGTERKLKIKLRLKKTLEYINAVSLCSEKNSVTQVSLCLLNNLHTS